MFHCTRDKVSQAHPCNSAVVHVDTVTLATNPTPGRSLLARWPTLHVHLTFLSSLFSFKSLLFLFKLTNECLYNIYTHITSTKLTRGVRSTITQIWHNFVIWLIELYIAYVSFHSFCDCIFDGGGISSHTRQQPCTRTTDQS